MPGTHLAAIPGLSPRPEAGGGSLAIRLRVERDQQVCEAGQARSGLAGLEPDGPQHGVSGLQLPPHGARGNAHSWYVDGEPGVLVLRRR